MYTYIIVHRLDHISLIFLSFLDSSHPDLAYSDLRHELHPADGEDVEHDVPVVVVRRVLELAAQPLPEAGVNDAEVAP